MRWSRAIEAFERGNVAVIMGDGICSRLTSLRLSLLSDTVCIICDKSRSPWGYLLPFGAFWRIGKMSGERLICEELCELADRYPEGGRTILFADGRLGKMDEEYKNMLESRYVLRRSGEGYPRGC